jgi:methionyl-tRNA formyltransferase
MPDAERLNAVFLGSGAFGLPTLERLAKRHNLLAIVTQPDRPAGRKRRLTPTPIGAFAEKHLPGVPLLKPENVNDSEHVSFLRSLPLGEAAVDHGPSSPRVEALGDGPRGAAVVIAFGQKLGPELLAERFFINLHASLLPRWRGAAPIQRSIEGGDEVTGNSVITLAERMDAGLVLTKTERVIDDSVTSAELHDLLAADGPGAVESVLDAYARGEIVPAVQREEDVTIAKKLTKAQGAADFSLSPRTFVRRAHAFNPWPCVTASFRGGSVKLLRAAVDEPRKAEGAAPGTLTDPGAGIVACGTGGTGGAVRLIEVQPAGKKPMEWTAFANGVRPAAGDTFGPPETSD